MSKIILLALGIASMGSLALADTITFSGTITQDAGGAATANPALNSVADDDNFLVTLGFATPINTPGTFNLTSVLLEDTTANVKENGFISGSLTVTGAGAEDQISVLGCLPDCALGNELDLNFQILATQLTSSNVPAQAIPALLPLDLLEDDGSTDIHGGAPDINGNVGTFSNNSAAAGATVPEPGSIWLMGSGIVGFMFFRALRRRKRAE